MSNLVIALTPKGAQWVNNYEQLEFLGDAVIALIIAYEAFLRIDEFQSEQ